MLCSSSRQWRDSVLRPMVPGGAQVEEALSFLQAAGLSGAAKYAAGTVLCCVDEAQKIPLALEREAELVLLRVAEAWQKLVSLPPGDAQPRAGSCCSNKPLCSDTACLAGCAAPVAAHGQSWLPARWGSALSACQVWCRVPLGGATLC